MILDFIHPSFVLDQLMPINNYKWFSDIMEGTDYSKLYFYIPKVKTIVVSKHKVGN